MPRVIPEDVLAIYDTAQDPWPFIVTASLLVDQYLGTAGLSAALLTEIERWWAAHLMASIGTSGRVKQRRLGETSITYSEGRADFWAQVLALDPTGILQGTTLKRASIRVD